jgi:hypothetical protein
MQLLWEIAAASFFVISMMQRAEVCNFLGKNSSPVRFYHFTVQLLLFLVN